MEIFIGEYVCGGGFLKSQVSDIPASLRREGMAMLRALVDDSLDVADKVHVVLDERFQIPIHRNLTVHAMHADGPLWPKWIAAARDCDKAIVIAPETDGILAQSVAMLQSSGLEMLNGFGDFLRCASNKIETARVFAAAGVPHPQTWTVSTLPKDNLPAAKRWVVKLQDGCGTENVSVFEDINKAIASAFTQSYLIQPWIEGRAVSIAAIVNQNDITMLPAVSQNITAEDIRYKGGCGPLEEIDQRRATALARSALQALPRTIRGFVGFDVVLGTDPADDCVIEVNPRITTSYVGLRRIVEGNLVARIAGLDRSPVRCLCEPNQVHWSAEGEVCFGDMM